MNSGHSETLDEHPTKTFQKKNIPCMMYMCLHFEHIIEVQIAFYEHSENITGRMSAHNFER